MSTIDIPLGRDGRHVPISTTDAAWIFMQGGGAEVMRRLDALEARTANRAASTAPTAPLDRTDAGPNSNPMQRPALEPVGTGPGPMAKPDADEAATLAGMWDNPKNAENKPKEDEADRKDSPHLMRMYAAALTYNGSKAEGGAKHLLLWGASKIDTQERDIADLRRKLDLWIGRFAAAERQRDQIDGMRGKALAELAAAKEALGRIEADEIEAERSGLLDVKRVTKLRADLAAMTEKAEKAEKHEAVCHCGALVSQHTIGDGHSPVEMPWECPTERERDAARTDADALAEVLREAEQYLPDGAMLETKKSEVCGVDLVPVEGSKDIKARARAALAAHDARKASNTTDLPPGVCPTPGARVTDKHDVSEEAKSLFWGAVGECDCNNESARSGMDAVAEFIESVVDGRDNIARIMADAADANVKSAAYERIEHAKTAAVLRRILAESGSYVQTKTREDAIERICGMDHIVSQCRRTPADIAQPNPADDPAGGRKP